MNLLVIGPQVLAASPFPFVETPDGNAFVINGATFPKGAMPGYQVISTPPPPGVPPTECIFLNGQLLPKPVMPVVPASIPRRKAIKYLKRTQHSPGVTLYDHIMASLEAIADPVASTDAITDFENSLYFERYGALIAALAPIAGFTGAQLDAMFIAADALP